MKSLAEKYLATFPPTQESTKGHNCGLLTDALPRKSRAWRGYMYMLKDLIDSLDLIHSITTAQ